MTASHCTTAADGIVLHTALLEPAQLSDWLPPIEARYRAVDSPIRAGERFVPTASSFTAGAVFPGEQIRALVSGVCRGPMGAWLGKELGSAISCDVDQAWVRRQYAPGRYPPMHAPHGWHQDGALKFDFASRPGGGRSDAVLPMVTCWIALDPCGVDAPGLELITRRLETLLPAAELADARVRARFASEEFWRPAMEPGDALFFRGDILHRTHVTPSMTRDRTSVELRFFPGDRLPARLSGDRFIFVG